MATVSFRTYLVWWWRAAWAPAWDWFGGLGLALGGVMWAWQWLWPENYRWSASQIGLSAEAATSDLVWIVPAALGAAIFVNRLVRAPYDIHLATSKRLASAEAAATTAEGALANLRSKDHGVDVVCSGMSVAWEQCEGFPPGVLVALDTQRIVNASLEDVAIEVSMSVPLWMPSPRFKFSTSAQPLLSRPSIAGGPLPQRQPLVNIKRKEALGPGVFFFFFSHATLNEGVMPPAVRGLSLEEFAKLVNDAEIEIQITDHANKAAFPPVPAPGTMGKRMAREAKERKAREDRESGGE